VYIRHTASKPLVVVMYVDDLLIAGPVDNDIDKFKQEMRERFKMSDLGLLTYYLGIEVRQDSYGIHLCQRAYAQRLLEKMGLEDYNLSVTSMETRLHLIKASAEALVDGTEYRSVVSALRYLIHTRPNLAHYVSYVSKFMAEPHGDHQVAVKRILSYIGGMHDHGVHYARGNLDNCCFLVIVTGITVETLKIVRALVAFYFIWGKVLLPDNHKSRNILLFLPARLST
jgi:hypothetical protein